MASHRKPRPSPLSAAGPRAALGISTAALATVTLLSESASAAPVSAAPAASHPSIEQVQAQVDSLNHQAEVASQRYDAAQEKTQAERKVMDSLLEQVARNAEQLNASRRALGQFAAAQYRTGGLDQTATFLLSTNPQQYFDQQHEMRRATAKQQQLLATFEAQQAAAARQRQNAGRALADLTAAQTQLETEKRTVQQKLAAAQDLLNTLTAQQKARLAAIQKQKDDAAAAKAAQLAAAAKKTATTATAGTGGTGTGSVAGASTAAAKAVAFAQAQLGKPYVWGATGPASYDCSGLTQAAWAAAGVTLPRTTWEQVKAGTSVSTANLRPGDLVFFYSDISHVGIYIGGGMMIHAPHTGTVVKVAPISEMPVYGAVRPS